jgi:hypothetical protein
MSANPHQLFEPNGNAGSNLLSIPPSIGAAVTDIDALYEPFP